MRMAMIVCKYIVLAGATVAAMTYPDDVTVEVPAKVLWLAFAAAFWGLMR